MVTRRAAGLLASIVAIAPFPAVGADIHPPVYKAPPVVPDLKFTGCFLGGNIGYGWGHTDWSDPLLGPLSSQSTDGVVGGGQVGCDYQVDRWVVGFQGMLSATALKATTANGTTPSVQNSVRLPWIGTLTGRIGITGSPTLYYVKGGAAFVRSEYEECCLSFAPALPPISDGFASKTRTGWTIGGGIEHIFVRHWSIFVEYNFIRLSDSPVAFTGINGWPDFSYNIGQDIHAVLLGVNYRF